MLSTKNNTSWPWSRKCSATVNRRGRRRGNHIGQWPACQWIEGAQTKVQGYPNAVRREQFVRHLRRKNRPNQIASARDSLRLHPYFHCSAVSMQLIKDCGSHGLVRKPCAPADNARNFTLSSGNAVMKMMGNRWPAVIRQC